MSTLAKKNSTICILYCVKLMLVYAERILIFSFSKKYHLKGLDFLLTTRQFNYCTQLICDLYSISSTVTGLSWMDS